MTYIWVILFIKTVPQCDDGRLSLGRSGTLAVCGLQTRLGKQGSSDWGVAACRFGSRRWKTQPTMAEASPSSKSLSPDSLITPLVYCSPEIWHWVCVCMWVCARACLQGTFQTHQRYTDWNRGTYCKLKSLCVLLSQMLLFKLHTHT